MGDEGVLANVLDASALLADLDGDGDDGESYLDWRVGISKEVLGFGLDVSYWNAENEEVFCGLGSQNCRGAVVGTMSRKF